MSNLTPLTSKNGESEWPYKKKTVIAIPELQGCDKCIFLKKNYCLNGDRKYAADCIFDFDRWSIYIEKPSES